jgi:hypothetical protein
MEMRIMIKFAKSMYSNFDSKVLNLKMVKDQVFAVTPEIEASSVYQDGIATKNFIPVTIANEYELTKVVNLSDAVRAEFAKTQPPKVPVAPVATPIPAPRPVAPVPRPIAQVPRPIVPPKPTPVKVDEPTLSFTEEAGNQKNAFEAISKMTDIKKLEHALKTDDRVGVQKALQKRIEELN